MKRVFEYITEISYSLNSYTLYYNQIVYWYDLNYENRINIKFCAINVN
jgi:hypothetical protein